MDIIRFDLECEGKKFKPLNATNGGPWHKRTNNTQYRSNLADYKAARIPYSRNHDSAVHSTYGGPYSHDITCIFPDFNADPYDPASYDFPCTDEAILVCLDAGTETFFRLGQTIEHQVKKHGTIPPADFKKWAVICEHIIRHYNEGWANGYNLNMKYWEIWNEPDLDPDDAADKRTWGGTKDQFFDFYEIAAKHLKGCFPQLKIGGPALAHREEWADSFLSEMRKRNVPIDFFSWHIYCTSPLSVQRKSQAIKRLLDKHGYGDAESILNEWNYIQGWTDEFIYSIKKKLEPKGAAFTMSCMCVSQQSDIDMLMYYDTRPSVYNGVFDFYTCERLKGYYPFYWYGMFYDMECEIASENSVDDIYTLCGKDKDGKIMAIVVYYNNSDEPETKKIALDMGRSGSYDIYLLDNVHDGELVATTDKLEFDIEKFSIIMIKEK